MIIERLSADIPLRLNSDNVNIDAAWFNTLRAALRSIIGCTKITVTHEDFTAEDTSEILTNANLILAAKEQVEWVQMKHTIAFSGGTISAMTFKLGTNSNPTLYTPEAFNVFQAVSNSARMRENFFAQPLSYTVSTELELLGEAVGDDVVNLTAGSCEIFLFTSILP